MNPDSVLCYSPRPESEVEWEDLLVRLEVMPRALSLLLEDRDSTGGQSTDLLESLLEAELFTCFFLAQAASLPVTPVGDPANRSPATDSVDRFVRLRARNFAIVQRRGIDVWLWKAEVGDGVSATVYQVLRALAERDSTVLAGVRGLTDTGAGGC
ncbi:MAG: hypothetical protein GEU90_10535 [Gemmatimonas sp.]|nr:hypothetical protein [Gemmatimonas sp.]